MKRGLLVLGLCVAAVAAYFTADRWGIHHVALTSHDILREDRNVTVQIAVRRDREMQAMAEMIDLPVAVLSHGNTVGHTEYSFLSNVFAARGYLVISTSTTLRPMIRW